MVFGDSQGVHEAIQGALQNPDLAYLVVVDERGRVLDAVNRRRCRCRS